MICTYIPDIMVDPSFSCSETFLIEAKEVAGDSYTTTNPEDFLINRPAHHFGSIKHWLEGTRGFIHVQEALKSMSSWTVWTSEGEVSIKVHYRLVQIWQECVFWFVLWNDEDDDEEDKATNASQFKQRSTKQATTTSICVYAVIL